MPRIFTYILLFIFSANLCYSQTDPFSIYPDTYNKKRFTTLAVVESSLAVASMAGLYYLWYSDYPQTKFHFINDNQEWRRMDKMGHFFSTYNIARLGYVSFRWTGLSEKKSTWFGGLLGFSYLSIIEILDGFSAEWGFSTGDMIANTAGTGLFISQQLLWKEQRIVLKYSYHPTMYADHRPDLLGKNLIQSVFDDYNGITIWASVNIYSFLNKDSKFPKWLNIALGYGADGMVYGDNLDNYDGPVLPQFPRKTQYYLALDVDLTKIHTNSKFMHVLYHALSFIKIPMPTIELDSNGNVRFYPLYF